MFIPTVQKLRTLILFLAVNFLIVHPLHSFVPVLFIEVFEVAILCRQFKYLEPLKIFHHLSLTFSSLLPLFSSLVPLFLLPSPNFAATICFNAKLNSRFPENAVPFHNLVFAYLFSPPENTSYLFIAWQTPTHPSNHTHVFNICSPQVSLCSSLFSQFLSTHTSIRLH